MNPRAYFLVVILLCFLSALCCITACDEDCEECSCDEGDTDDDVADDDTADDDDDDSDPQHEITEPIELLNPDGSLKARGWARHPLIMYNPQCVPGHLQSRLKEWDAYLVVTPEVVLSITISDIRLVSFVSYELIEFATDTKESGLVLQFGSMGFMPLDMFGSIDFSQGGNSLSVEYDQGVRVLTAHFEESLLSAECDFSIVLAQDPNEEDVAAAAPFYPPDTFFYENKIVGMTASGEVTVKGKTYTFDPVDSFGVLDWGRGIYPHINEWHWGVAAGYVDGGIAGFNIGDGWLDNSLGTSNAQKINGVLHKLYYVYFDYDPNRILDNWHVVSDDGKFEATLEPFYYQKTGMMILDLGMLLDKVYGRCSGTMTKDDGTVVEFEDLIGFIEWSSQRW